MFSELYSIPEVWSKAWQSRSFRNQLFLSLMMGLAIAFHQFHYLVIWQGRSGVQVNDMVLNMLPPMDFSIPIFVLEYLAVLLVLVYTLPYPDRLVKGLQMFTLIFFARTITVYFIPLEPPKDMIFLVDPVANFFLHTNDVVVTKDLFFSGHISAITLLMLIVHNRHVKRYTLFAAVTVGALIMWQHVHYTMDVLFAPMASYTAYKLVLYFHRETRYGLELQDA